MEVYVTGGRRSRLLVTVRRYNTDRRGVPSSWINPTLLMFLTWHPVQHGRPSRVFAVTD